MIFYDFFFFIYIIFCITNFEISKLLYILDGVRIYILQKKKY
jgi:hypothetical protein